MENASKALFIAGGMLLVMLVLSFAAYFFRKVGAQTSEFYQELSESDISEFNNEYLKFDGKDDLRGQDVVSIVNLANDSERNLKIGVRVTVNISFKNGTNYTQDNIKMEQLLDRNKYDTKYTCNVEIPDKSKIVEKIYIVEN